jgi:ABC-type nitrate/sulfonate/bicarbonate transport system permease component
MATAIWTIFAVGTLAGIFAGCVIAVTAGIRLFENRKARRLAKPVTQG